MSENKYRDYLNDDRAFHREYLTNKDEPSGSSLFANIAMGVGAVVGLAAGSKAAFDSGLLRQPFETIYSQMGKYKGNKGEALAEGIRMWSKDPVVDPKDAKKKDWLDPAGKYNQMADSASRLKEYTRISMQNHKKRMEDLKAGGPLSDRPPESIFAIQNTNRVLEDITDLKKQRELMRKNNWTKSQFNDFYKRIKSTLDDSIKSMNNVTADQQQLMMQKTGHRMATVQDLMKGGKLTKDQEDLANRAHTMYGDDFLKKVADPDIMVNKRNEVVDLRNFRSSVSKFMNSLANDFTIPFIKINPIKMFYMNELTDNTLRPSFQLLDGKHVQPLLSRNKVNLNQATGRDALFANGKIFDLSNFNSKKNSFEVLEENAFLASAKNGAFARLSREMFNVSVTQFDKPKGKIRGAWYEIAKPLDIGFQDAPIEHSREMTDPATPYTFIAKWLEKAFKPYGNKEWTKLENAFGHDSDFLAMRKYKPLEKSKNIKDYFGQFFAARNQADQVTTASFFPYAFFQRLNSTLNTVGMGLSTKHLGSAQQIATNLVGRRLVPALLAVEGYKYANYEFENFFGDEFEDGFAEAYKNMSVWGAGVTDATGITSTAKEATELMPGINFLGELPLPLLTTEGVTPVAIGDLLQLDKTQEEVEDWYENGYEPVRRGRYWEFGNTPFVGSDVKYFEPNWYRRITSDYQYTDTLWGSKDEYWANHALPTLSNPFAPIRHFVTDPYHYEKKHYEDRPYMQTGGIPEIESIPVVGQLLSNTVGQLLKPTQDMHQDEWGEPGAYKETTGYDLAQAFGVVDDKTNVIDGTQLLETSRSTAGNADASSFFMSIGDLFGEVSSYEGAPAEDVNPMAYITSSGRMQVMARPFDTDLETIRTQLEEAGINKVEGVEGMSTPNFVTAMDEEAAINQGAISSSLNDAYNQVTEVGGFYGWASTMAYDASNEYTPKIETSERAFGYQNRFWDLNLGNLGGDANEIFRRAVPRDAHKNYVNDIKNTMPSWMPGGSYFTDFQHGDPYVKVDRGEMRLPGESYEKLYGLDDPMEKLEFHSDPAMYGADPKQMVQHLLNINRLPEPEVTEDWSAWAAQPEVQEEYRKNFQTAVSVIEQMLNDRVIGRGDLYSPVDRYRILSDVAPYSDQYRQLKSQLSSLNLTPEEREEVRTINEQVRETKEGTLTYDYRFQTANVENEAVTVTKVIDNNTFLTEEYPDNPIRLAGVYIPTGQSEEAAVARGVVSQVIHEGANLTLTVNADEENLVNDDTYKTIDAVVRGSGVENLNREIIKQGLGKEETDDYSPAAVRARFTDAQVAFGSAWEEFAHLDTPLHTKLLQVRSPLEQYKRREVYGKDWQDWSNPVDDYFVPWYQNWISKDNAVVGIGMAAWIGSFFGNTKFGKAVGAMTAATAASIGYGYKETKEVVTGEEWVPERRQDERELEEYIDMLKYVKNMSLYEEASEVAKKEEGFDVEDYMDEYLEEGEQRQQRIRALEGVKRDLMTATEQEEIAKAEARAARLLGGGEYEDISRAINKEIASLQSHRDVEDLPAIAAQAITYYNQAQQTMYGYDPGEPLSNLLSALPKKERDYFNKFLEAPEEERDDILAIVPDYVKRALQSSWGMEVDEKPELSEYFSDHELPDASWVGWDPRANLDHIRVKMVNKEGLDYSEFNIWEDDIAQAEQVRDNIVPDVEKENQSPLEIKRRLQDILGGHGIKDLDISVQETSKPGFDITAWFKQDRRDEIIQKMNEDGHSLF